MEKRQRQISTKQVSTGQRAAYGVGTGIVAIKNMLFHFFFIYFYDNVVGVGEGWIIAATTIAIFFDAVSDPLMGQVSDNFRSKAWGRRHLFMALGIVPTVIGLVALFSPPAGIAGAGAFAWMLGFLLLVRLGLTIYDVPYRSLGAELSTDYDERTSIVAWREFFTNFFSILVFIIGLILFFPERPGLEEGLLYRAGYTPFVVTMCGIGAIFAVLSTAITRRKVEAIRPAYINDAPKRWTAVLGDFGTAFSLRPFVWLCAGYCLMLIIYAFGSAISFYVGGYLWRFSSVEKALFAVVPLLALLPAVLLTTALSKRMGKKRTVVIMSILMLVGYTVPYIGYLTGTAPAIGTGALLGYAVGFHLLGFSGLVGILILSNSMMADVVDLLETKTGRRQEGLLASSFSFAQKLTFVVGSNIVLIAFMFTGSPDGLQPGEVPETLLNGLAWISLIIPLVFAVAGIFSYSRYRLTRAEVTALQSSN
jgi:Na+/melibiose symporter-like transporter